MIKNRSENTKPTLINLSSVLKKIKIKKTNSISQEDAENLFHQRAKTCTSDTILQMTPEG
jgi:methylthioribose-1-phosphate isomerase